jgi:putative transposase
MFLPGFLSDTLEELNVCLDLWLREQYHPRVHSSTGESPFNRFARHLEMVRIPPVDLEDHFRREVRRRVAKDRTVSIDGRLFEAPTRLIGERVSLLFQDQRPDRVEIFHQGVSQGLLTPVDLVVNSQVKREGRQGLLPFKEAAHDL